MSGSKYFDFDVHGNPIPIPVADRTEVRHSADGKPMLRLPYPGGIREASGEKPGRHVRPQDALLILAEALVAGPDMALDAAIERGQTELVNSVDLPSRMQQGHSGKWPQPILEAAGVKFDKHDGKSMFRGATLPQGWKKVRTGHSMWSHLVDDKGRVRAEIFYKSSFGDTEAFLRLTVRFYVTSEFDREGDEQTKFIVRDTGNNNAAIFTTESCPRDAKYDVYEGLREKARAWLKEHYPNHNDESAYWDLP